MRGVSKEDEIMILMIDNYDSFTYNIVQYCQELGADVKVVRNDQVTIEEIEAMKPEKIIISPGPATPDDAGISLEVIRHFQNTIPIFGICLGHQAIGQVFGAKVIRAKNLMHGKTSVMHKDAESVVMKDIPETFTATRYHSLVLEKETVPDIIKVTAHSTDDNEIMAIEIKDHAIYGVQFHPESIMSEYGYKMLENFLKS